MKLNLVLASESPRRKSLLEDAGFSFHIFPVKVSENLEKNLNVDEQILHIAQTKADAAAAIYKPSDSLPFLILSADTMVVVDDHPLGKPKSSTEAFSFLRRLSGRSHQVKTAVVLLLFQNETGSPEKLSFIETTEVFFRELSDSEIQDYIQTGEPMDKAGAYGIQGLARKFVLKVEGSLENVIGLPIEQVKKIFEQKKWNAFR